MPNDTNTSCTVILNGHGRFLKQYVVDFTTVDYNITFPVGMKQTISNAHHNLILGVLTGGLNPVDTVKALESLPSTYKANKTFQQGVLVQDMFEKETKLVYQHGLSNADDVIDMQNLVDVDNTKYCSHTVAHNRQWNNATIELQFNFQQAKQDVINVYQQQLYQYNIDIKLSKNNLLYIAPKAPQGIAVEYTLSDLLTDIIPKIKIPVIYHHQDQTVDILNYIFIDDNQYVGHNAHDPNCQIQACQDLSHVYNTNEELMKLVFPQHFQYQNDAYHELTVAGDANIIWDSCREEA